MPKLTLEEKKEALEKAQEIRIELAKIRKDLKNRKISVVALLSSTDKTVGRMRIVYMLESLPAIGKTKAAKIMAEIGISKTRRIQGLGKRQREALYLYLDLYLISRNRKGK